MRFAVKVAIMTIQNIHQKPTTSRTDDAEGSRGPPKSTLLLALKETSLCH